MSQYAQRLQTCLACEHHTARTCGKLDRPIAGLARSPVWPCPIQVSNISEAVARNHNGTLPTVAVVIPCHNYGEYLEEAIGSIRSQTWQPVEVVAINDRSTDDTVAICKRIGVRCVTIDAGNVWQARKKGESITESDLVCFLDADDLISPDYLKEAALRFAADWRLGVVYSDLQDFGESDRRSSFPARASIETLRRDNYIHAGAVVRRSALRITDAFNRPAPSHETHEDYFLWRHLVEYGFHAEKQDQLYLYRKHGESMMTGRRSKSVFRRHGLALAEITILIPLAGRSHYWPTLRDWLDSITWPKGQISLVLADTSQDAAFGSMVRDWLAASQFEDVRYFKMIAGRRGLADAPRADDPIAVQDAVLRIWSKLTKGISTPWTLTIEDDTIPPPDILERFLDEMRPNIDALVAPYLSRFMTHWVAFRNGRTIPVDAAGEGLERVDGSGFGCMLCRSEILVNHTWTHGPHPLRDWYDPWFTRANNLRTFCDWRIPVRHLPAEEIAAAQTGTIG